MLFQLLIVNADRLCKIPDSLASLVESEKEQKRSESLDDLKSASDVRGSTKKKRRSASIHS